MTHQNRTDASSLPTIDDDKCHFRPPGLKDDVPATPDDDLTTGFLCECDNRDVILEIDVHEEGMADAEEAQREMDEQQAAATAKP